jgi:2-polyprenyl-3-methyl-5-hydroxy-6-metoxy-1,4-benzoquinol methylase
MKLNLNCYLCGADKPTVIRTKLRDIDNVMVLQCQSCGLVFLSSFDHINNTFYQKSMMHGINKPDFDKWADETLKDDMRRFSALKNNMINKKVLDFGAGNCNFILKTKQIADEAYAIELDESIHKHCSKLLKSLNINLYHTLNELPSIKFDVITMFHVIEHLIDPRPILSKLHELLADNGRIIIETPNSKDALLSIYKCEAFADFTYWGCHVFLYDENTLSTLMKQCGFINGNTWQIQRYNMANHLYWLSMGKPGGDKVFKDLSNEIQDKEYEKILKELGTCDTLMGEFLK